MATRSKGQKPVEISFDESNRIRILDPEDFTASESLAEECQQFTANVDRFSATAQSLVQVLQVQSNKIEKEKLMAIGQKNRIDGEHENRKRQQAELRSLIAQRRAELQRDRDHCDSLVKVEQEQRALLERLVSNNNS